MPSTCEEISAGIIDEEYGSAGEAEQREEPDLNDSFIQAHKKRKLLTKKIVHDIDSSLEPNNYDTVELPTSRKFFSAMLEKPKGRNDRGSTISWSNQPPVTEGRQGKENVITGRVGVRGNAKTANSPRKAWELFFTRKMLEEVVRETIIKISSVQDNQSDEVLSDDRYCYFGNTNEIELSALSVCCI